MTAASPDPQADPPADPLASSDGTASGTASDAASPDESGSTGGTGAGGYAAALAELESLLATVDSDDVDIDRLAEHVARANELIRYCRDRIRVAEDAIAELGDDAPRP